MKQIIDIANELQKKVEATVDEWCESIPVHCKEKVIMECTDIFKENAPEIAALVGSRAKIQKCRKETSYAFEWWVRKQNELRWKMTNDLVKRKYAEVRKMAITAEVIAIAGLIICLIGMFR